MMIMIRINDDVDETDSGVPNERVGRKQCRRGVIEVLEARELRQSFPQTRSGQTQGIRQICMRRAGTLCLYLSECRQAGRQSAPQKPWRPAIGPGHSCRACSCHTENRCASPDSGYALACKWISLRLHCAMGAILSRHKAEGAPRRNPNGKQQPTHQPTHQPLGSSLNGAFPLPPLQILQLRTTSCLIICLHILICSRCILQQ